MSSAEVERCLATLYSDAQARRQFLRSADSVLQHFMLTEVEREAMHAIDKAGLIVAGNSFSAKRAHYKRWMHDSVKTMLHFESFADPVQLVALREAVLSWLTGELIRDPADRFRESVDFIAWDGEAHHNREHMLDEAVGLNALMRTWTALRSAPLLNHHLLRCYAVAADAPHKTQRHRGSRRSGTYLTYIPLAGALVDSSAGDLVLYADEHREVVRFPLMVGSAYVMPADMLHQISLPRNAAAPLLLTFLSSSAIQ